MASYPDLRAFVSKLLRILNTRGREARIVGGAVRDRYLGFEPVDYDLATSASPEEVMTSLEENGIRYLTIGLSHGTVTALESHHKVEVTTLRKDQTTDGRRASVEFHDNFEEDAMRRDFTMNALSIDAADQIHDYFGGRRDLDRGVICFVGDPSERIKEDYLRILRFFRFRGRYNLSSDEKTLRAVTVLYSGLNRVSAERITKETVAMFSHTVPLEVLQDYIKTGLFHFVFRSTKSIDECLNFAPLLERCLSMKFAERSACFLALVCLLDPAARLDRLKLSRSQRTLVDILRLGFQDLSSLGGERADAMELIDRWEKPLARGVFQEVLDPFWHLWLNYCKEGRFLQGSLSNVRSIEEQFADLRQQKAPLNGHEIKKLLGIEAGSELGELRRQLLRAFRNGVVSTKEEANDWLRDLTSEGHFS